MLMFQLHNKAQVTAEFLSLLGFLLFFLALFIGVYLTTTSKIFSDRFYLEVNRFGNELADQINTAYLSGPGFSKIYQTPLTIFDQNYSINVQDKYNRVEIKVKGDSYFFFIVTKNVTGNFTKGRHFIKNIGGIVNISMVI